MIRFLLDFARRWGCERIVFEYEASDQGFGLCDLLTDQGIECHVLSPVHLAKSAKWLHQTNIARETDIKRHRAVV